MSIAARPRFSRQTVRTVLASALLSLVLLAAGAVELATSYQDFIRQGFNQARVSNLLLTEWVQREFREIELIQNALSRQLSAADFQRSTDADRSALETRLVRAMYGLPQAYDLILVDRECQLVLSFKVSPGFDARERSYCKAMLANTRDDSFVSERFRTESGDDVVLVTHRVRGDDGQLIGLVGTAVRVEHFQSQLNRAVIGSRYDVLLLTDSHLQMLARQPMLPKLQQAPVDDEFARTMLQSRQPEANYQQTSPLDQRARLYNTSKVEHLPLLVTVGVDRETLLAPWWAKLYLFLASWSVMLLLIALATRRYLQNVQLGEALAIRSAAIDHAAEAIVIANGQGQVEYVNPAFTRMTGLDAAVVCGQRELGELLLGHHNEHRAALGLAISEGQNWRGELSNTHADGHNYYETVSVAPVRNQAGELIHVVAIKYDISASKKLQADLERLANTDELTGLHNRRLFLQRAQEEIARGQRWHRPLSLAMLDLDYFKRINDRYGHGFGDEVLRRFAACIQFNVRMEDVCGRLGGEEFAILLPDTDRYNAGLIMERVRVAVENIALDNPMGGEPVRFTVSIGISELYPGEETPTPLIARADASLYLAKQDGRNCVRSS